MHVDVFTKGKTEEQNEDFFGYDDTTYVVADGATDKSGNTYNDKTGGEIAAHIIVATCLQTNLNGPALVKEINQRIRQEHIAQGILEATEEHAKNRFTGTFVCVRHIEKEFVITALGDVSYRLNGIYTYSEQKEIDIINAKKRADYITETHDIPGSRRFLYPHLSMQFAYQNIPEHPLGYGTVDGSETPDKYVHLRHYPSNSIERIEIFTDGYYYSP
ncbi:MAG: hypothetical protein COU33_05205, partial [Candidatus Magasanikbacteria bacterium CG10_big_fil_rev_8_21_14_0_10_43_6]